MADASGRHAAEAAVDDVQVGVAEGPPAAAAVEDPQVLATELEVDLAAAGGAPLAKGATSMAYSQEEDDNLFGAKLVSVISLTISCAAAACGVGLGLAEQELALIGFGVEALLDALSSAMVLWRFKRPQARRYDNEAAAKRIRAARDAERERYSAIGIGATFVASAVTLSFFAMVKVATWDVEEPRGGEVFDGVNLNVALSFPCAAIYGGLAIAKLRLARALDSQVLYKDAFCSFLGSVFATICTVAGFLQEASESTAEMAMVDSTAGGVIAVLLMVEGVRTLRGNLRDLRAPERKAVAKDIV